MAAEGWRFAPLMRLVPLVPFNLQNYALGLTGIGLSGTGRRKVFAAPCMQPSTVEQVVEPTHKRARDSRASNSSLNPMAANHRFSRLWSGLIVHLTANRDLASRAAAEDVEPLPISKTEGPPGVVTATVRRLWGTIDDNLARHYDACDDTDLRKRDMDVERTLSISLGRHEHVASRQVTRRNGEARLFHFRWT